MTKSFDSVGRLADGPPAFLGPNARAAMRLVEPGLILKPNLDRLALGQTAYVGCERVQGVS